MELQETAYWKKWEVAELLVDLSRAVEILGTYKGGKSEEFNSAEEFHSALLIEIKKIQSSAEPHLDTVFKWFAPSYSWDELTGMSDSEMDLGNEICLRCYSWVKEYVEGAGENIIYDPLEI